MSRTGAWRNGERLHVGVPPRSGGRVARHQLPLPAWSSLRPLSHGDAVAGHARCGWPASAARVALRSTWPGPAAGRTDGCFDLGLNAWDVAAGSLLVTEAGGQVGNFRREPDFLETRECLAANPAVFAALTDVLRPFAAPRTS